LRQHLEALRLPVVAVRLTQARDQLTAWKLPPGVELQHLQPLLGERVPELQPAAEHRYRQAAARQSLVVAPRMRRIDDVVVVRVADTAEGPHAQADAARAERIARGFEGPLGELRGGGEFDARLELLERRQGERHRRTEQEGRNQGAQDACRRDHAVRTWCAGAPRTAPSRTRDATCRAAR